MMPCPNCETKGSVLETRSRNFSTYRRYRCEACENRWSTVEIGAEMARTLFKDIKTNLDLLGKVLGNGPV